MMAPCKRVAVCLVVLAAGSALAQEEGSGKQPLWEVGAFALGVSTPAYPGAGQQLGRALVLPYAIYRGDFLRIDRSNIGVRKVIGPHTELDLGFAGAFGASSSEIEARRGMPDLGTLVEFGPRIKWRLTDNSASGQWRAEVALRGVFDLSAQLRDKGLALEPKLGYEERLAGGWRYGASVGLVFGDRRLTDTLYGVAPAYAHAERNAYEAASGLIASRLQSYLSRSVTPRLRISGVARWDSLAGSANQASPLVQKNTGTTVGLWLTYTLAQSDTMVSD
jgi:outer membrane protein